MESRRYGFADRAKEEGHEEGFKEIFLEVYCYGIVERVSVKSWMCLLCQACYVDL